MDYNELRTTVREWFREQAALSAKLKPLPLAVTNEGSSYGVNELWLRQTLQSGPAAVAGVGSGVRLSRRNGRITVEIFGPKDEGEADVSLLATEVEGIFRAVMPAEDAIDPDLTIYEPYTFERLEPQRYCQVVSVPFEAALYA